MIYSCFKSFSHSMPLLSCLLKLFFILPVPLILCVVADMKKTCDVFPNQIFFHILYIFNISCSVSFHCFYHILLLRRSCNYQMKIYVSYYFQVDICFVHKFLVLSVILPSEQLNHLEQVYYIYVFFFLFTRFCSDLNNHSGLVSLFERVCVFPGRVPRPQLQFVFNSPGPKIVFHGPRLQLEFTVPGPKFVFSCSLIYS